MGVFLCGMFLVRAMFSFLLFGLALLQLLYLWVYFYGVALQTFLQLWWVSSCFSLFPTYPYQAWVVLMAALPLGTIFVGVPQTNHHTGHCVGPWRRILVVVTVLEKVA